tara:strand:+ start:576 stop:800 length:225 start_codon:yes stop_codon:yes gene_type:complete
MPKNELVGQKFKLGDKVLRKNMFGTTLRVEPTVGTIYGVRTKQNSRGSSYYYYAVQWEDRRRTENAQHSLEFVN